MATRAPLLGCLFLWLVLVHDAKPSSCSFYCFIVPSKKEAFQISSYRNLSCTHFVYGFNHIRSGMSLHTVTYRDNFEICSPGNLRKLLGLRNTNPDAKLLLGVKLTANDVFQDVRHARQTAAIISSMARKRHFDGVFVRMEGPSLESSVTQHFLSALSAGSTSTSDSTHITLAFSARWMWRVANRLYKLVDYVQHVYLDMEELPSSEDAFSVSHLDPLMPSESIPPEDTISGSVKRMVNGGVPAEMIVVGLSSGGRTFKVRRARSSKHGDFAVQKGDRQSLQDLCHAQRYYVDSKAACTVVASKTNWTSVNFPTQQSLGKKIEWIAQEGLAGVGISPLQFDDPKGKCGIGSYPSHTMIGKMLKCRARGHYRRPSVQCNRLCFIDHTEGFDPHTLQPHWCSYFVVGPADILVNGMIEIRSEVWKLIARINQWMLNREDKPAKIILSVGARQENDIWRKVLESPVKRKNLVSSIKETVQAMNASGVEISWTLDPLDTDVDSQLLSQFLNDLRTALPKGARIMISISPLSSSEGLYNVDLLKDVADRIILQTHRLHDSRQQFTYHHSPIFLGGGQKDSKMTVESFVKDWISRGVPSEKLFISITSVPSVMKMVSEFYGSSRVFGLPANPTTSSVTAQISSQTDICKSLRNTNMVSRWIDGSEVPVLTRGSDFIAFENERSAKIKSTWASSNNLGGLAIHGLPFDNPNGECPERPYPILQSIIDTQVCPLCALESVSGCFPSFQTVCNYRLPQKEEEQPLYPNTIPFERCSEVVVEHAVIDADATVRFPTKEQKIVAEQLKEYRARNNHVVIALRCSMRSDELAELMETPEKRLKLIAAIRSFVDTHSFNGVELRCADLVSRETKSTFSLFLRGLIRDMKTNSKGKCSRTVSIRLSAWHSDLRSIYDIMVLNSLHHVVLEPFTVPLFPNAAFVHSPLFPVANMSTNTSIDTVVRLWESSGLKHTKILLQIPAYGMEQLLVKKTVIGVGRPTRKEYAIIGQAELCQRLKYAGTERHVQWDSMTANAWTTGGRWISIEDQQTVKYKVRYALREGLAGVGLMSLNEDDHMGTCGSGTFPILRTISTKCH